MVESSLAILINTIMNENELMQYRQGKKGETYRIGSALRQGEVKTIPYSGYAM